MPPPSAAEMAPSRPQRSAANDVSTAMAMSCQRSTMRKGRGWRWKIGTTVEPAKRNHSIIASCDEPGQSARRGDGSALEALYQAFELVEARIVDDDRALAARPGLQGHGGPQRLGELLLQAARIGIQRSRFPPRRRRRGRLLHQALGLAHREALLGDLVRELDLARPGDREQRARV